jgi:hypothetical protein
VKEKKPMPHPLPPFKIIFLKKSEKKTMPPSPCKSFTKHLQSTKVIKK